MREVDVVNAGRMVPPGRRMLAPGDIWQAGDRYLNTQQWKPIRIGKEVLPEDLAGEPIGSIIRLRDLIIERGVSPEQLDTALAVGYGVRDMRRLTAADVPQAGDRVWDGTGWLVLTEGGTSFAVPAYGSIFRDPKTRLPPDIIPAAVRQAQRNEAIKRALEPLVPDAWTDDLPDADLPDRRLEAPRKGPVKWEWQSLPKAPPDEPVKPTGKRRFRLDE